MVIAYDALMLLAGEHVDDIVDAKPLTGAVDTGQGYARSFGRDNSPNRFVPLSRRTLWGYERPLVAQRFQA